MSDQLKQSAAFTLIEVLMALGILVMAVSIIANLQFRSLTRVLKDRDEIEKTFLTKKEHYRYFLQHQKQNGKITTKLEELSMVMTTEIGKINSKSPLAQLRENLRVINTTSQWRFENQERSVEFLSFVFKPTEKKDKAAA